MCAPVTISHFFHCLLLVRDSFTGRETGEKRCEQQAVSPVVSKSEPRVSKIAEYSQIFLTLQCEGCLPVKLANSKVIIANNKI